MIDTGAGETALTEADAQQLGFMVDPNKYEVIGDGASGMVRGQYVQLKSIDVGGIRQSDAKAVIVAGATVSLLGQPFLEKVDEIVIRNGEMRLKTTAAPRRASGRRPAACHGHSSFIRRCESPACATVSSAP